MVSELSARLLKGYSITYSTASPLRSTGGISSEASSSTSGSSKQETGRKRSTESRLFSDRQDDYEGQSNRDACFKRRKIDELRFAASRVKEDLEKGGLPFPSIHDKKPRALEGYDIDMSNIQLLGAKSVADSPFLTNIFGSRPYQSMSEVDQLFNETRKIYTKHWVPTETLDWDRNSTGSLTSDSESSCVVDIAPLLEDALKHPESELKTVVPMAALPSVSMRTALENCIEPRLVTLSFAPFLIIHVNSAYTRITGIPAKDILGKQIREIFKDRRCKSMAGNMSSLACMHDQLTSVSTIRQDKRCNCRLRVSLVGADAGSESASSLPVTHCMISVKPTDVDTASFSAQPIVTAVPNVSSFHCEVMG